MCFRPILDNLKAFFDKPWKLPLVVLLGIVAIGVPNVATPVIKQHYQIGLDLQEHKCLPYTLYFFSMGRVDKNAPENDRVSLNYGDMVSFVASDNIMGRADLDGKRIVKLVAGLPGDLFEVRDDSIYINGDRWGGLTLRETLGHPKGHFDHSQVIPPGKVLLLGTTDYSYDGRYYGLLDQSLINAQAYPII